MKTTNLEISKKLKEIGFEAKTDKCWAKIRNSKLDEFSIRTLDFSIPANCDEWYPAYDLETLLGALPNKITTKFKHFDTNEIYEFEETLKIYKSGISYSHNEDDIDWYRTHYGYYSTFDSDVLSWEGESLADAAGKLLIELFEAGIVNFKK